MTGRPQSGPQSRPAQRPWPEWFIVRAMGDETLVYDLRTQRVTSLNAFASRVWQACDGTLDADRIASKLADEGEAPPHAGAVDLALDLLSQAGLVEARAPRPRPRRERGRREFVRRLLAGGAAAATPAVVSVLAPPPAEAASGCTNNGQCSNPTPYCQTATGTCVRCLTNSNCLVPTSYCKTATGTCVRCLTNANCANPTPICSGDTCVACTASTQCNTGLICVDGSCTEPSGCTSDGNCNGATPYCRTATGECVECLTDAHCFDAFYPVCVGFTCTDGSRPSRRRRTPAMDSLDRSTPGSSPSRKRSVWW